MISYQNDKIPERSQQSEFKTGLDVYFPIKTKL